MRSNVFIFLFFFFSYFASLFDIRKSTDFFYEIERFYFLIFFLFFFRFSLRYTEIGPSEFVGGRSKVLYSTRATRRNQKHGISPSFYLKFGKSSVLVFSQIYGFLPVRIGWSIRSN